MLRLLVVSALVSDCLILQGAFWFFDRKMVLKKRHFQTTFQFLIAEEKRMYSRVSKFTRLALTLACTSLMPIAMAAQDSAKPAPAASNAPSAQAPSKWDIFAGYSYLAPKGDLIQGNGAAAQIFAKNDRQYFLGDQS